MIRITAIMISKNGKPETIKIKPIECENEYLKLYRSLFRISHPGFEALATVDLSEKEEINPIHDWRGGEREK